MIKHLCRYAYQVAADIFNGLEAVLDRGGRWLLRHPATFVLMLAVLGSAVFALYAS
jgi:hypothetical protein